MSDSTELITTPCGTGCPQLLVDHDAPEERRIVVTDAFGQRIEMSVDQLRVLIDGIKFGVLDLVEPDA
ncbi:MAG TPA: hypothetical protein VJX10_16060 [Pseudonocardiaceae bacterium]|nr:hypothetical protein [Pseudonocardiaceae bacterium]